eukprot:SAG31_NODE_6483_length_2001_cov_1.146162_1_plen_50_part_00
MQNGEVFMTVHQCYLYMILSASDQFRPYLVASFDVLASWINFKSVVINC